MKKERCIAFLVVSKELFRRSMSRSLDLSRNSSRFLDNDFGALRIQCFQKEQRFIITAKFVKSVRAFRIIDK